MVTILGYGSLLNVASLQRTVPGLDRRDLRPVLVRGFCRLFNLTLCLRGAYSWGRAFGDHFVDHTWLADGERRLRDWLPETQIAARLG